MNGYSLRFTLPSLAVYLQSLIFPLVITADLSLPHRFDQSNQSFKDWVVDQLKGLAIGAPLGLIMIELIYLALRLTGNSWWLWVAGGLLLFNVLIANLAPVLIMPLFNKFVPLGDEHKELEERLLNLAKRANTKVKGVFKFDMSKRTKSANAALTGLGNTRRIILGDTLINEFTLDEIETVLAHELGHHVHKDIPFLIAFGTLSTTLGLFIASLALDYAVSYFSFTSIADIAAFPALMLILGAYGLLTSPIDNAVSRWRENMADDYALSSTKKGEAFASAFTRLANQNLGEIDPEKWVVFMFYSHPPLGERIEKAKRFHNRIIKTKKDLHNASPFYFSLFTFSPHQIAHQLHRHNCRTDNARSRVHAQHRRDAHHFQFCDI